MSRQTDELMHYHELDKEDAEGAKLAADHRAQLIALAKNKLRLLQDLNNTPGFQVLLQYLQGEAKAAFNNMERTENQLDHTRASGMYCALKNVVDFVPTEIQSLIEELKAAEHP